MNHSETFRQIDANRALWHAAKQAESMLDVAQSCIDDKATSDRVFAACVAIREALKAFCGRCGECPPAGTEWSHGPSRCEHYAVVHPRDAQEYLGAGK